MIDANPIFLISGTASGLGRAAAGDGGFEAGEVRDAGNRLLGDLLSAGEARTGQRRPRASTRDTREDIGQLLCKGSPNPTRTKGGRTIQPLPPDRCSVSPGLRPPACSFSVVTVTGDRMRTVIGVPGATTSCCARRP